MWQQRFPIKMCLLIGPKCLTTTTSRSRMHIVCFRSAASVHKHENMLKPKHCRLIVIRNPVCEIWLCVIPLLSSSTETWFSHRCAYNFICTWHSLGAYTEHFEHRLFFPFSFQHTKFLPFLFSFSLLLLLLLLHSHWIWFRRQKYQTKTNILRLFRKATIHYTVLNRFTEALMLRSRTNETSSLKIAKHTWRKLRSKAGTKVQKHRNIIS